MGSLKLSASTVQLLMEMAFALFFAFLFLQSGLDKLMDRKGNRTYIDGYFAKTPLRAVSAQLFIALTVLEVAAGVVSGLGFLQILFAQQSVLALWGALLSLAAFLGLFLGQRLAKDYAAAAAMVPYFLAGILGVYVLR